MFGDWKDKMVTGGLERVGAKGELGGEVRYK